MSFMSSNTSICQVLCRDGNYGIGSYHEDPISRFTETVTFQFHSNMEEAEMSYSILSVVTHSSVARSKCYIRPCESTQYQVAVVLEMCESLNQWRNQKKFLGYQINNFLPAEISVLIRDLFVGLEYMHSKGLGDIVFTEEHIRVVDGKAKICLARQHKAWSPNWNNVVKNDYLNFGHLFSIVCGQKMLVDSPLCKHLSYQLKDFEFGGVPPRMFSEHPFLLTGEEKRQFIISTYTGMKSGDKIVEYTAAVTSVVSRFSWIVDLKELYQTNKRAYRPYINCLDFKGKTGKIAYEGDSESFLKFCRNFLIHLDDYIQDPSITLDDIFYAFNRIWPLYLVDLKMQLSS